MSHSIDIDDPGFSLRTRLALWRNQLLARPGFQSWASRIPLIRRIVRHKAAAQFDLVAGFVYSQILHACVEADLFPFLADQPRSLAAVAQHAQLGQAAAERLLRGAAALRLVESPQPMLWILGEAGAALTANPGVFAMVRHHALLYRDLADPLALLRDDRAHETALSAFWHYAPDPAGPHDVAAAYSALMAATQPMVHAQIVGRYDFARHIALLDVGGGSGRFLAAASVAAPALRLGLFDLPPVIAAGQPGLAEAGIADRVALHPGSFRDQPLPGGYDLISLVRILHDHDDEVAQHLLRACLEALPRGGTLLIVEPFAEEPGAARMGDAYFGLYLWAMRSGRPRSARALMNMLKEAGFSRVSRIATPLPIITGALAARK